MNRQFKVLGAKIRSGVVFFRGKVVLSLQDPIFLVFFGFQKACLS